MTDTPITDSAPLPPPADEPTSSSTSTQAALAKEDSKPPTELPPVTTGSSEYYIQRLADAVARASSSDPLTRAFQIEKLPAGQSEADLDLDAMQQMVRESAVERATAKLAAGGFIAEAAGFAAVACWEPARSDVAARSESESESERPLFAAFLRGVAEMSRRCLDPVAERVSAGRYWKLSLMARDPEVEYVPGAVRAVLVPFIERFTSDQNEGGPMPVWLEAGSSKSRSVYAHFGFRDAGECIISGVKTWGMIYTGNIDLDKKDNDI
ncbi:hypothetical protein M426DRAFT_103911 [Hypoxylon sp. CI-4A]|nr:hypothetical protein M426DRAFT_103911 [Hypoxylon sp. CI-4A]